MMLTQTTQNTKTKLAAIPLSVAATLAIIATPSVAAAQDYHPQTRDYQACKTADKDSQIVGGLIGAVLGGVAGSQISGSGARTEGSVLGAVLGGAAGAGIADDRRNCRAESRVYDRQVYPSTATYGGGYSGSTTTTYPTTTTHYPTTTPYGSTSGSVVHVGHGSHNSYPTRTRRYDRGYSRSYDRGYSRRYDPVAQIDRQIEALRAERREVKRNARYNGHRHTDRRLRNIGYEIDRLKDERRLAKKGYSRAHSGRIVRRSHYHGRNICYSDH